MPAQGAAQAAQRGSPHLGCAAMHVQRQGTLAASPGRQGLTLCRSIASFLADGQLATPPRKYCRKFLIEMLLGE